MATLISAADGSFQGANNYASISTSSNASLFTTTISVNTTTSVATSGTFTTAIADTLDGLLMHCKKNVGGTGTVTVTLYSDAGITVVRSLTFNASDLPSDFSWVFIKFGSSVAGNGLTVNRIGVSSSVNASAAFSASSGTNWCRAIRKTALVTPAVTDIFYLVGEITGAGAITSRNQTMLSTVSTDITNGMTIGYMGTLAFGTASSTTYIFATDSNVTIWSGGTMTMGTVGTPMPSTSSAQFRQVNASITTTFTVKAGGTLSGYGAGKTNWSTLAANSAAAATSSTLSVTPTGWLSGDVLAFASTTRTNTEAENKSLTGTPGSSSLSHSALTNAHSGTSPTQCEVGNLTRNVRFGGTVVAGMVDLVMDPGATISFTNAVLQYAPTTGYAVTAVAGSFTLDGCVLDYTLGSASNTAVGLTIATGVANVSVTNSVFYNHGGGALVVSGAPSSFTFTGNLIIQKTTTATSAVQLSSIAFTFSTNTVTCSGASGIMVNATDTIVTMSGNTAHSNTADGIRFSGAGTGGTISNMTVWRNGAYGANFTATQTNLTLDTGTAFGNATANFNVAANLFRCSFPTWTIDSGATLTCPIGLKLSSGAFVRTTFVTSTFGSGSSHATGDVSIVASSNFIVSDSGFNNCLLASTTEVDGQTNMAAYSVLFSQNHDQVAGAARTWLPGATIRNDTVIYNTATPSARGTPTTAARKSSITVIRVPVPNGESASVSVYVRKSVIGDGTAYNGAQPRLILKAAPGAGIATDVVLDTATSAADGAFEQLTGTSAVVTDDVVLTVIVDYDGTTGWINTDDASATLIP